MAGYQDTLNVTQDNKIVPNQIQGTTIPTATPPKTASAAWDNMTAAQQTNFINKNPGFNASSYGLSTQKVVTPTPIQQPVVQGSPDIATVNTPQYSAIQNQVPNIPKTDIYGDYNKQGTAGQTTTGVTTAPGTTVTDLSKVDTSKINPANYQYGQQAISSGTDLTKRNYDLATYYAKQGTTKTADIYAELMKQPAFAQASEADRTNTANAIAQRIGSFGTQPQQGTAQGVIDNSLQAYMKDMGIVDSNMQNALKLNLQNTISQMAVAQQQKDKYSNFDDVMGTNQTVVREFSDMRKKILETGDAANAGAPVTQQEIDTITQKTGISADDVKASLNGTIWQQLTPTSNEANTLQHDQFVQDETTAQRRATEDLDTQLKITTRNIDNQIDDVARQMERTMQSQAVAAGLSGSIQSNGVTAGLKNIKDDAQRTISRLEQEKADINAADAKTRGRLLENFNQDISRAKSQYDTMMSQVKLNAGVGLTNIQNQYALGSDSFTQALQEFKKNVDLSRGQVLSQFYTNVKQGTDALYANTEKLLQIEQTKTNLQKSQEDNLFRDNGAILYNTTSTQLQQQVKDGTISQATYNNAIGYMTSLATSTLSQMGTPTSQDIQTVQTAIKNGKSPSEAIAKITQANPGRFKNYTIASAEASIGSTNALANQRMGKTAVNTGNAATSAQSITDGSHGGECVAFVNDILEKNGMPAFSHDADQSLANKLSKINSQTPTVGSVMVRTTPTADGQKYGDAVIVTGVNGDTISYKGSNVDGNGTVYSGTIKKDNANIKGYYDPSLAQSSYNQLNSIQKLQADTIYAQIYGKKSKVDPAKQNTIANMFAGGKDAAQISAELMDMEATKKYTSTMNGATQIRLKQAVNFAYESLPLVENLSAEAEAAMKKSGITQFANVQRKVAESGALGQEVKSAFTKLDSQITDMVAELAVVYKGGNSPTDQGMEQATKMLDTNRDYQTMKDNIALIKRNLEIRQKSIQNVGVATPGNAGIEMSPGTTDTSGTGDLNISGYKPSRQK